VSRRSSFNRTALPGRGPVGPPCPRSKSVAGAAPGYKTPISPHSSSLSYLAVMVVTRSPYTGCSRKLVLAFDIGTTSSGISYALLDPGSVPQIRSAGRWPKTLPISFTFPMTNLWSRLSNDHRVVYFEIPSALLYDDDGSFRGVKDTVDDDEDEVLHEVRWWDSPTYATYRC